MLWKQHFQVRFFYLARGDLEHAVGVRLVLRGPHTKILGDVAILDDEFVLRRERGNDNQWRVGYVFASQPMARPDSKDFFSLPAVFVVRA